MRVRAWHVFLTSLGLAFLFLLASLAASFLLHQRAGDLSEGEARVLLRLLYWGTYPLVFVALGALGWHFVQAERGAYAKR
jgi:hypothetical protein